MMIFMLKLFILSLPTLIIGTQKGISFEKNDVLKGHSVEISCFTRDLRTQNLSLIHIFQNETKTTVAINQNGHGVVTRFYLDRVKFVEVQDAKILLKPWEHYLKFTVKLLSVTCHDQGRYTCFSNDLLIVNSDGGRTDLRIIDNKRDRGRNPLPTTLDEINNSKFSSTCQTKKTSSKREVGPGVPAALKNAEDRLVCKDNEFTCAESGKCISLPQRCDGNEDCVEGEDEKGCCESDKDVDLFFQLGGYWDTDVAEGGRQEKFVNLVVSTFNLTRTRFSLSAVRADFTSIFKLRKYTDRNKLKQDIAKLPDMGLTSERQVISFIERIESLRKEVKSLSNRNNQVRMAVVVLGKYVRSRIDQNESKKAQDDGILMYVVGTDDYQPKRLSVLSSQPAEQFALHMPPSVDVKSVAQKFVQKACPDCKSIIFDFSFLIDVSGSVSREDFTNIVLFLSNFVTKLELGKTKTRLSVTTYSGEIHDYILMNQYYPVDVASWIIRNIYKPTLGETRTNEALDHIRDVVLTNGELWPEARIILFLITDGKSTHPKRTEQSAKKLREFGMVILAISKKTVANIAELENITANKENIILVDDYRNLNDEDLWKHICKTYKNTIY